MRAPRQEQVAAGPRRGGARRRRGTRARLAPAPPAPRPRGSGARGAAPAESAARRRLPAARLRSSLRRSKEGGISGAAQPLPDQAPAVALHRHLFGKEGAIGLQGVDVEHQQPVGGEVAAHPGQRLLQFLGAEQVVDGVVEAEDEVELAEDGQIAHVGDREVHRDRRPSRGRSRPSRGRCRRRSPSSPARASAGSSCRSRRRRRAGAGRGCRASPASASVRRARGHSRGGR